MILIAVLVVATASAASSCPAGYISREGSCVPCPAGTYRQSGSANSCVACRAGTFQPARGAISSRLCRPCYPGSVSGKGSAKCSPCPRGRTSGFGASRCVRCPAGYEVSFTGASCNRCNSYSYAPSVNSPACKPCYYGIINKARTECRSCKVGDKCFACPRSMYRPPGGECTKCPPGTAARTPFGKSVNDCKPCPAGSARGMWDSKCEKCPPGTSAPAPGATACRRDGTCPYDSFINARGVCETCMTGSKRDAEKNICVKCPKGYAGAGGRSQVCRKCPNGSKVTPDGDECTCGDGYFLRNGTCKPCAAGSYRNNEEHRSFGCVPCPTGYVSQAGAAKCTRCPYGRVANREQTECVSCPSGTIPNLLSEIDLYYEYGQRRCVNARTGREPKA